MNASKVIKFSAVLLLIAATGIGTAWADRGRRGGSVHFGVVVGPHWDPWYYPRPYPYYYPPYPPVVIERAPPVYIEQYPPPAPVTQTNYWYYCSASKAYYPYVNECPSGWQRVSPQPPPN